MKGSHRIIVESRKVKYDFVIQRNITIITGDSGSGKTVLTFSNKKSPTFQVGEDVSSPGANVILKGESPKCACQREAHSQHGKGVYCKVESEGSLWQTIGPTDRNHV